MVDFDLKNDSVFVVPSGKQVLRTGEFLISTDTYLPENEDKLSEAFGVLSYWRYSFEKPLENALEKIQKDIKQIDNSAIFAKRLKRLPSIVTKLRRFPKMNLKNMQDIGGCRIVLSNTKKLTQVSRLLRKMPEFHWEDGFRIKDYIKKPKDDGYRGIHLIGKFPDSNGNDKKIEIQLRTRIQHHWATALEIIDLFTNQSLKTNQGSKQWSDFFSIVSNQFSLMDNIPVFEKLDLKDKKIQYFTRLAAQPESSRAVLDICDISRDLKVIDKLKAFANSLKVIDEKISTIEQPGYVMLEINLRDKSLEYIVFGEKESKDAEEQYSEKEKETAEYPYRIIALVYANALGGIKEAYPNFFADSTKFTEHLELITEAEKLFRTNFIKRFFEKANLTNYK